MLTIEFLFLLSLLGVTYSYFIYPIILLVLPKHNLLPKNDLENNTLPFITLIITAYNEENSIKEKIQNTLETTYPNEQREILIASDGSTDKTNEYVNEFSDKGIRLVEVQERKGKENAQLSAIKQAKGSIIVFSDVATRIDKDALQQIAHSFQNEKVGAISSEDRFISDEGEIAGEGAYVKYEMWLRNLECSVNSLVGLSGSFFAARKEVCEDWSINVPSDFNTALNCVSKGFIAISNPKLLGYYPNIKDESKEYPRKLRTVIRGIAALFSTPQVLNPFKFGLFSFQVLSHKLMRWAVPWFMISLFITSLMVWDNHILFALIFIGQLLFYGIGLIGLISKSLRSNTLIKLPFFFIQVNMALFHASILYLFGKRITKWEPSKR